MLETIEETVISGLQALASYGAIAAQKTWNALATPENFPIFLSNLIKSSLGPALAFVLGFRTFNHQENIRREKEAEKETKEIEAFRLILELEIKQNLATLEGIADRLQYNLLCFDNDTGNRELLGEDLLGDRLVMPKDYYPLTMLRPSFERTVYDTQVGKLPTAYRNQPDKLSRVIRHYHYLSMFSRLFMGVPKIAQWEANRDLLRSVKPYLANDADFLRNLN